MANPDGTKQVSPPTKSAFVVDKEDLKAAPPVAKPETTVEPHEKSFLDSMKDSIKKWVNAGGGEQDGKKTDTDTEVGKMSQAIDTVPGNSTDYG